ncbi:MAG: hypothetical protein Q8O64_09495 [Sideroxyarcus sp.]|nr:hypothetical protein [Sideroxyarcus sp.]
MKATIKVFEEKPFTQSKQRAPDRFDRGPLETGYAMKKALGLLFLLLIPFTTQLGGCGGTSSSPQPLVATPTYLHYTDPTTSACSAGSPCAAGTLTTINPNTPTDTSHNYPVLMNSINAMGGNFFRRVAYVATGIVSGNNGTLSNMKRYAVVFSSDGKIVKQSTVPVNSTTPPLVQISNTSNITPGLGNGTSSAAATDLCELDTFSNFQNPDKSSVYYKLAGLDKICNNSDDVYYWLSLGALSTTAPTLVAGINSKPFPIYDTSTGNITGFVALNGGAVAKFNATLGTPVPETTNSGPFTTLDMLVGITANGKLLVLADNGIRSYDPALNTLGPILALISNPAFFHNYTDRYTSDADNFYFVDNPAPDYTSNVIQKISLTTPATAAVMLTEAPADLIQMGGNTLDRVIYKTVNSSAIFAVQSVKSIAKSGTTPTILHSVTGGADYYDGVFPVGLTSDKVYINYYHDLNNVGNVMSALVVDDDGTNLATHADAKWMAFFSSTTSSISGGNYLDRVVLLQRNGTQKVTDDGATLTTYNAANHVSGATLGTVPSDISSMYTGGIRFDYDIHESGGSGTLMTGAPPTPNTGSDIFYVNGLSGGSLARITSTSSVYKQQLNF